MYSTRFSCHIETKLELTRYIFEKFSNVRYYQNPSIGRRDFPCRQTDRHMIKLTFVFPNFANARKINTNSAKHNKIPLIARKLQVILGRKQLQLFKFKHLFSHVYDVFSLSCLV